MQKVLDIVATDCLKVQPQLRLEGSAASARAFKTF